jgi:large subunit ribosomal protein L25
MDTTLAAEARGTETGKGVARKLRATGKIPAVIYGPNCEARPLAVDPTALQGIFKLTKNRNTVVQLDVPGEGTVPCLVREAQRHPLSRDLLHVDFYRVDHGHPVQVKVPVRPVGKAAGAALGGRLRMIRRELWVRCDFERIPATLDLDVTPMNIGDMLPVSAFQPPEGVEIIYDNDFNVVTLYGKRGAKVVEA